jgi:hypothetical protein
MSPEKKKRGKTARADLVIKTNTATSVLEMKTGGGKLSRSEVVTVRLDQKLRYLADLAARKQRRTLSSFIEGAIERALAEVKLSETSTVEQAAGKLWDIDESDRFVKLAFFDENLLTYDEQVIWKLIQEWNSLDFSRNEQKFDWEQLRQEWPKVLAAAEAKTADSTKRK